MTDILSTIEGGNEAEQGMKPRSELTARELMREVGAVLRMSEAEVASLVDTLVWVAQPGAGDLLQYMKAGALELPDVVAVN